MEGVSYPNEATAINGEVLDTLIKYYSEGAGIQNFENKVAKLMEFGGSSHLVPNTFNPNAFQDVLISTDLTEINSFWERKDGYFAGKWWQDERKLAYAAAVLEHEAELRGQIAINESPLQYYNKGKQDNRLITVQALSMSNVTQTYSPDTAANLEYIFHSQGITDINNITAEGVEALKKYYDSVPEYSKSIDRAMTSTAGQYFQKCAEMMILGAYMRYGEFLMQPSAIAVDEAEAVLAGEEIGLESTTGTFVMESSGTGTGTAYLNLTENAEFFSQYSMITEQDMLALQEMPMYGFTMEGAAELIPIEEQAVLNTWGALTNNVGSINNVIESGLNSVDDIIKGVENGDVPLSNNIQKGNYGEMKMDAYFESQGYERISLDRVTDLNTPTHQGIDGVYYNPDGHPPYIIGEAKYGSSRLSTLADGTPQMSDKWIIDRLENAVGEEVANDIKMEMILNPDNVGSSLVHVSPDGGIDITELIDGIKQ